MPTTSRKYAKCARCHRRVRLDTEAARSGTPGHGLWEHEGKEYGWDCYNIVVGNYPPRSAQVVYKNPDDPFLDLLPGTPEWDEAVEKRYGKK